MKQVIVIGLIILLVCAAIVHFWGVTAETLVVLVIGAFVGGYLLGKRRRVNNR